VLTLLLVMVVFSTLILVHEAGHMIVAKKIGVEVKVFSLGFGRRLVGFEKGGTDYRISLFPFGGYVKMAGEDPSEIKGDKKEYLSKAPGLRFWVLVSGALSNYIFAFILFSMVFMVGMPKLSNEVGRLLKGYPAEKAGMKVGDRIVSINDKMMRSFDDILAAVKSEYSLDESMEIEIVRGQDKMSISVMPEIQKVKTFFGHKETKPLIGMYPKTEIEPVSYPFFYAFYKGGQQLIYFTGMTYKGFWLLLTRQMPVKTSVAGPIGIVYTMGQAANLGIGPLLFITAHVSLALAIFNLMPFPIFDGGHIVFLFIEKLRGKPVNNKFVEVITLYAFWTLVSFAMFISWLDITRLLERLPFFNK